MTITTRPRTIGELRESGYKVLSVKEELRKNLIQKIRHGEEIFPGIIGYEDTVIPQVENAILSGQDIIFLGERGQAKTRMARSLVNLLDEVIPVIEGRDVQIPGYKIRLPLDVYVVASANPEDYTNRGRIITPLKDRVGSEIRTHYPTTIEHEISIMESESNHFITEGMDIIFPQFMKEVIAEITQLARRSNDISQRSGVSVRVSVSNFENVLSSASRRALRLKERYVAPRISDLSAIFASTSGKIELDSFGDIKEERVVQKLINAAVLSVFGDYFENREFEQLVAGFERGLSVHVGDDMPSMEYVNQLSKVGGLSKAIDKLNGRGSPASIASSIEFILEGLHLNRRLNKDEVRGKIRYRR